MMAPVTRDQLDMPQEIPMAPYFQQRQAAGGSTTSTPTLSDQLDSVNEAFTLMNNLTPEGRKFVIEQYLRALGAM